MAEVAEGRIESAAGIAEVIAAALRAQGCRTSRPNADEVPGGDGYLDVVTPGGVEYRVQLTAERGY